MSDARRLSLAGARSIEWSIIALCVGALVALFQPWSLTLFGVGCGLVVLGGLAFNLIPHCVPGRPARSVVKVALIVLVVLLVAIALAVASAFGYVWYLQVR